MHNDAAFTVSLCPQADLVFAMLPPREREKRHKERDDYDYEPDGSRDGRDGYSSRSGSRSRSQSLSPEPRPPGESSYVPTPPEHTRNPAYYSRRRWVEVVDLW